MPPGFDPYPLVLLALGMLALFVLIIRLKVHAFLALIGRTLVGLLSPPRGAANARTGRLPEARERRGNRLAERNLEQLRKSYEKTSRAIPRGEKLAGNTEPRLELTNAPDLVARAFGRLMIQIGLSIAFATIIGAALMESGSADRIVRSLIRLFGERYAALALLMRRIHPRYPGVLRYGLPAACPADAGSGPSHRSDAIIISMASNLGSGNFKEVNKTSSGSDRRPLPTSTRSSARSCWPPKPASRLSSATASTRLWSSSPLTQDEGETDRPTLSRRRPPTDDAPE